MPFGQPKKYTDEYLDKLAVKLKEWAKEGLRKNEFRLLSHWALENDFSDKNFTRYAPLHENFRLAYEFAKQYQEHVVAAGALTKKLDSGFSQFFLQCRCGWKKQEDSDNKESKAKSQLEKISNILHGVEIEDSETYIE